MKISLISFTRNGANLAHRLEIFLNNQGYEAKSFATGAYEENLNVTVIKEPLKDWTRQQFCEVEGIIFIGATGIAVRAISPFLRDKSTDPAVLVIDETGRFVIPLLSGHIGGANELAVLIAEQLGTIPVITTATDINHKFAVDVFAKANNLYITRMDYAKKISATLLQEEDIGFKSDFPVVGSLPEGVTDKKACEYGISISLTDKTECFDKTLCLIPRIVTLGIGCRKGKKSDEIEQVIVEVLRDNNISIYAIEKVASIDLKKEEAGLLEFCEKSKLTLVTYPAAVLKQVKGAFKESEYVESVTGVGNVCERAAILGSSNGIMLQRKYVKNGIAVSIARRDWRVNFE